MKVVDINNTESLKCIISELYDDKKEDIDISFSDSINLHIKIKGNEWNGLIDYRIANFVIRLQNDILKLYNASHEEKLKISSLKNSKNNIVVNVKIDKGCTEITALLTGICNSAINICDGIGGEVAKKMESKHLVILIIALALFRSCDNAVDKLHDYGIRKEEISVVQQSNEHLAYIASQLAQKETIVVNGAQYTKSEALEKFKKPYLNENTHQQSFYIDGEYEIFSIDVVSHKIKIWSKSSGIIYASTNMLSDMEINKIYEDSNNSDKNKLPAPKENFRLTLTISGETKDIFVVGIDSPRNGSMTYAEAVNRYKGQIPEENHQRNLIDIIKEESSK